MLLNPWFSSLPGAIQLALIDEAIMRRYVRGEVVYAQGVQMPGVFAILTGQVLFEHRMDPSREFILHIGGPLFWFGQAPILNSMLTENAAVARTDASLLLVPAPKVRALLVDHPELHSHFSRLHGRRYLMALVQLAEMSGLSGAEFLRRRLHDLARLNNLDQGKPPETPVELALSQEDVAKMIGVSRQTVNGYLAELESLGLLQIGFRLIRINDPTALLLVE